MNLIFKRKFKSITAFEQIRLPDFTILTGVNGAGKSHLLEAIESGAIEIEGVAPNVINRSRAIRRFDSNTLIPQDTGRFSAAQISQEQAGFWQEISQYREQYGANFRDSLKHLGAPALDSMDFKRLINLSTEDLTALGIAPENATQVQHDISSNFENINNQIVQMFARNDPENRNKLVTTLSKTAGLPLFAMDEDDFIKNYPKSWQPVDLFQQSFARLFTAYQHQWRLNKLKSVANNEGENIAFLTEPEFLEQHGSPPWIFLNEILEAADLDFRINEPNKWDDRSFEPILTDEKRDLQIKFNDLSSGERILMSFALCLYHANDQNSAADFPKVLLFDEIDAPLHPSMTRSLLRTIQKTLVEKHQIKVVLTTHSPSTVALAPEGSIHVMSKQGNDRLRATSKDAALGILTSGVPTLSVNYSNRRQVFVESKYDAQFYGAIFELSKNWINPEISLTFISSGAGGNGSCDQVRSVVTQLHSAGSRSVFGLIDWDGKNESEGTVLVLGGAERYSIENYVLDPMLIGLLLLRERLVNPEDLGLGSEPKYLQVGSLSQEQLQLVAHAVTNKLAHSRNSNESDVDTYAYSGGSSVLVPKWISMTQGHALEEQYKNAFPSLRQYQREPALKNAVIERVIGDCPQFIPKAFISSFTQVQNLP